VYHEFPKMLYRGATTTAGRVTVEQRTVATEREEADCLAFGWTFNPEVATKAETARQAAIGTAAAERAFTDRQMSASAQAEAAVADQAAGAKHLGEIRERPRRPRPSRAKAKKETAA
jgi:hypothetical protein